MSSLRSDTTLIALNRHLDMSVGADRSINGPLTVLSVPFCAETDCHGQRRRIRDRRAGGTPLAVAVIETAPSVLSQYAIRD